MKRNRRTFVSFLEKICMYNIFSIIDLIQIGHQPLQIANTVLSSYKNEL